jgi:hypothetical protein
MELGFRVPRHRSSTALVRLVAGAAAATVLILTLPSPAAASPTPSVTISDVTVTEGTGAAVTASFTIQVAPPPKVCCSLQVSWATAPGSATAPGDFTASSGTVTLSKSTTSRVVSVPIVGDATDEPTETFVVNLSNLVGSPGQIGDAQGVGTITDNDSLPTLSAGDVSVTEGNAGTTTATFTVSLSAASGNVVTFDWATAAGTATGGVDYVTASGSRSIPAGATSATVAITVNGDTLDEVNETFTLSLSNPGNATIADGSGAGTITDDDAAPGLSIGDVSLTEGNAGTTTATFTVSLAAASGKTVTFDWATAAGTATAGVDYVTASGSRTIAAGATSATIAITVNGDVVDEANETFTVGLSNPSNATIADGSGTGTITDDDALPTLSVDDVSVTEGDAGTTTATFTVSLSAASGKTVTVGWATADDDAVQPADYTAGSGTLTFLPDDTSETFAVSVKGDAVAELDEMFRVTLAAPVEATLADAAGIGTIVDDELLPVIDIDEPIALEADGVITFSVTLSHGSGSPVTVDWTTAAGTASNGSDYFDTNGTVTFAPNDTLETVQITVNDDATFEHDETMALNLANASGAPIGDAQGIGTISNDDDAPGVTIADASVTEGDAGQRMLTFQVSLAGDTDLDATVGFAAAGGTASAGTDYLAATGTLTIPAGETTATIDVVVNGDATYEVDETLSVTLSDPSNAQLVDGTASGTIRNDDKAPTAITLRVRKAPKSLTAKGVMEYAKAGLKVTATLYVKKGGRFLKVTAKTARIRDIRDRDHDGKPDGSYTATFVRPKTAGTYKVVVRFKGTAAYKPCIRTKILTLSAS